MTHFLLLKIIHHADQTVRKLGERLRNIFSQFKERGQAYRHLCPTHGLKKITWACGVQMIRVK